MVGQSSRWIRRENPPPTHGRQYSSWYDGHPCLYTQSGGAGILPAGLLTERPPEPEVTQNSGGLSICGRVAFSRFSPSEVSTHANTLPSREVNPEVDGLGVFGHLT